MDYLVAEYGVSAAFLLAGVLLMYWGWRYYSRLSKWLTESKKTTAEVIGIEVTYNDESAGELNIPTFRYQTTGEILVTKSKQLFDKGLLKVGGFHTIRYNSRTPGKVQSDMADDNELMTAFLLFGTGGLSCFIALVGLLLKLG